MQNWEYRTVALEFRQLKDRRGRKYAAWVADTDVDGARTEGLDEVLSAFGKAGWELVALVTENSISNSQWAGGASTTTYRAVFKREAQ